jgi:hypothetical protein
MADFPYTANPANLKHFFDHVQTAGVPPKLTIKCLESAGFKSKNDRAILSVLKAIGFVDDAGVPTDKWRAYRVRGPEARAVMAAALHAAYSGLFATYPDAHRKDNEALRNYFSAHTNVGEGALSYIVRTFKILSELADFEATPSEGVEAELTPPSAVRRGAPSPMPPVAPGLTVNINVQFQLPATDDEAVYDKLFGSLKRHLFS